MIRKRFFRLAILFSRHLSFAKKFTALIVLFSIPLLFLLGVLIKDINKVAQVTNTELQGLKNLKLITSILYDVQDYRDYSVLQEVNMDEGLLATVTEKKVHIGRELIQLNTALKENLYNNKIEIQFQKLLSAWEEVNKSKAVTRGGIETQFSHYDKIILQMELLIRVIAYESALVHDESPRNFFLINLFINDLADIMRAMGNMRAIGSYALSMPTIDSYTIDVIEKQYENSEATIDLVTYSSIHIDEFLDGGSDLQDTMSHVISGADHLLDYFYNKVLEGEKTRDWHRYFDETSKSIENVRVFNNKLLPFIEESLLARQRAQHVRFVLLVVVTMALYLVTAYFVVGVYFQLRETLLEHNQKAMELANGNWSLRMNIEGRAELSELGVTFNNMAELLQKNQEMLQANQDQLANAQKMASMGRMISGIAHEVNTPLGIAITSFSLSKGSLEELEAKMAEGKLSKQALTEFIEISRDSGQLIERNLNRVAGLIETFKQINSSQNVNAQKSVDLQSLLLFAYSPYEESNTDVRFSCDEMSCEIDTDVNLLTLAISSIIENAIEHGLPDRNNKTISISLREADDFVYIDITDNGKGMAEHEREKLFEPFYTTGRIKGKIGLGMHVVYIIVTQSFAGKISVISNPDEFTKITLALPKYRDDCEDLDIDIDNFL